MSNIPRSLRWLIVVLFAVPGFMLFSLPEASAEGQGAKNKAPFNVLPEPSDSIVPLETKKIEEVGGKIASELEAVGKRVSDGYWGWLDAEVFLGVNWLKLLACGGLLVLTLLMERIVRFRIRLHLERISRDAQASSWKYVGLRSLGRPLSLFILVYGTYFSLTPFFLHFQRADGTNLFQSIMGKAADLGGVLAVVWFGLVIQWCI